MLLIVQVQPAFADWNQQGTDWYYEQSGQNLIDSWHQDETGHYYLQSDGSMATGWKQLNGIWYFFNPVSDGTKGKLLAGGWYWIDGYCYYFNENGEMLAANTAPDGYTVNENGAWEENGQAVYRNGIGIITKTSETGVASKKTSSGGSGGGGGGGSSSSSSKNKTETETESETEPKEETNETNTTETESKVEVEAVIYAYQILYKDIDTKVTLKEVLGEAEKDFVIAIDHPFFEDYEICEDQPEELVLSHNNAKDFIYYKADIVASDSNASKIHWEVRFVDAETHQVTIASTRSGTIQEGGTITINYMPQVTKDGIIWTALAEPPLDIIVEGFGDQIYYIEYEPTGEVTEPEDPYEEENKQLSNWLNTAKEAENLITSENLDSIPDSRFIVTNKSSNDARIRSITNQISDEESHVFYVIGKNYIPNGTAIIEWFGSGAQYSIVREATIVIDSDTYTVTRINISLTIDPAECPHTWELTKTQEATCLYKGTQTYTCANCGEEVTAYLPALGHVDTDKDGICDRCGDAVENGAASTHWNIGDIQAQELDGQIYFFECIDQNYEDESTNHNQTALFLCTSVIPANTGSEYKYEKQSDGTYDYTFYPGPIVNFGSSNDYKYSNIRSWLKGLEDDTYNLGDTSIGVSYAYMGSTREATYDQFADSELNAYYIGNQKMVDKLFVLSIDEAIKYKEYLWEVEETGTYAKGYWLRSPMGTSSSHDTDYVYIVDVVNGNIRSQAATPSGSGSDEEIDITGTTGVRPAYTMPQD